MGLSRSAEARTGRLATKMDQRTFRKINVDIAQRIINGIDYSTFDDQETHEKDSRKRNQKYETIHESDDNKDS